ncbi:hypothetical protein MANY_13330 [Mycolicibacterium anyangense]|uniref:Uncharacterized protein n=1 Tax=Mycolicibacterium anyangense TaxID=1431246 RepID=A0A6N4W244_9MYCO|nr:hypothetical protein MANY_13330 [Mycolicibacterium anyangense]
MRGPHRGSCRLPQRGESAREHLGADRGIRVWRTDHSLLILQYVDIAGFLIKEFDATPEVV